MLNKTLLTIYSQIIAGFCVRGTETTVKYLLSLPFALFNLDRKWITVDLGTLLCFYSQLNVIFWKGLAILCMGRIALETGLGLQLAELCRRLTSARRKRKRQLH